MHTPPSLLIFYTRLLLFLLIGFVTLVIGYPIRKLLRPGGLVIEAPILGSWTIILLVYLMGIFEIQFRSYVTAIFLAFLAVCVILIIRQASWHFSDPENIYIYIIPLSVVAIASRIIQIQTLYVPNWLDGIAHYRMTANILAKGFVSAERIYHAGFHSLAAFMSVLLPAFPLTEIILVLGQWLSFLAGLSTFLLIRTINPRISTALLAGTAIWFFSPFPSYLVSWSRYPLLAGMVFFPLAFIAFQDWIYDYNAKCNFLFVIMAGSVLFLTHYYILFIWAACLALHWFSGKRHYPPSWQLFVMALVLLVLTGLRISTVAEHLQTALSIPPNNILDVEEVGLTFRLLLRNSGSALCLLLLIGISTFSVAQQKQSYKVIIILALGIIFELTQNFLSDTRPPGIQNTIIFSTFPIIYAAVIGLQHLIQHLGNITRQTPSIKSIAHVSAILIILAAAYNISMKSINPNTILFDSSDNIAFEWINTHTENNSIIAIEASSWNGLALGCDGGAWLPYLTNRKILLMESILNISSSQADYLYDGGCQDPIYKIQIPSRNIIYDNGKVAIFSTAK